MIIKTGNNTSLLPVHDSVDQFALLAAGSLEVDPGGVDGIVAEKVGEEDEVIVALEEVLSEEVAERVRVDDIDIDTVLMGELPEAEGDAARGERGAVAVQEEITAVLFHPGHEFSPKPDGEVEATHFPPFGVDVDVPGPDMFTLQLDQLADPGPRRREGPDDEIPPLVLLSPQSFFIIKVILVADNVVQERGFGDLDGTDLQVGTVDKLQVLVDGPDPEVDGLGPIGLDEEGLVLQEVFLAESTVMVEVIQGCVLVCDDGVRRIILPPEFLFKCFDVHGKALLKARITRPGTVSAKFPSVYG